MLLSSLCPIPPTLCTFSNVETCCATELSKIADQLDRGTASCAGTIPRVQSLEGPATTVSLVLRIIFLGQAAAGALRLVAFAGGQDAGALPRFSASAVVLRGVGDLRVAVLAASHG